MTEWKRKSFTTRGADPTETVSWIFDSPAVHIVINEFQNVYTIEIDGVRFNDVPSVEASTKLHQDLEREWREKWDAETGPEFDTRVGWIE